MKFIVNKNEIREVLSKIQGLTSRRTAIAIIETVLIKTTDTGITIAATDLETGFEGLYPAVIESPGAIAINSKKLFEIVRDFPTEDISIQSDEKQWIEIGKHNVQYHIVGMNPDDYPNIPKLDEADFFEIDSSVLKKMIEKTIYIGAASDDKRPHISGIFFERILTETDKIIRMISTDGSRLSLADHHLSSDFNLSSGPGILIPKKGLNEVSKFLGASDKVRIGIHDNRFIVKKDFETFNIRLLEGDFPKYNDIIRKIEGHTIRIDRRLFQMMLKRMSIMFSENYKGVIFCFDENKLVITATNPDVGESKEEMPIEFDGGKIELAFNPKFFIDALNVMEADNVVLHLVEERRPCLIEGEDDKDYLSVIMPMKI